MLLCQIPQGLLRSHLALHKRYPIAWSGIYVSSTCSCNMFVHAIDVYKRLM